MQNCEKLFLRVIFRFLVKITRLTFFKTRFARYKKVQLVKCPISRHILATKRKIPLKNNFSQFCITYHYATKLQFEMTHVYHQIDLKFTWHFQKLGMKSQMSLASRNISVLKSQYYLSFQFSIMIQ